MFHTYLYITYVYKYGVQPLVSRNTAAATGRLRGSRLPVRQSCSARDVTKGTLYIYIKTPVHKRCKFYFDEIHPAAFTINKK